MAALDNQTKINPTTSFYGSGSQAVISTLNNLSTVSAQFGSFSTLEGASAVFSTLSCPVVYANLVDTNFLSASIIDIDGQALTATATELLLNGVPLATTSNLSSVGDWALDPAISTVQMDGNNLVNAGNIQGLTANISSLYADEIVAINQTIISTLVVEHTVSSLYADFQDLAVSTMGCDQATIGELTFISQDGTSELQMNPQGLGSNIAFQQFYNISSPSFSTGTSILFHGTGALSISAANALSLEAGNGEIGVGDIIISSSSNIYGVGDLEAQNLKISTINGAEFTQSSITVNVIGVSSLVATSISSLTAGIKEALVSTLQFSVNPSFTPELSGSVNLGLGNIFGNLAGAATGALGLVVGGAALGTGVAALHQTRATRYINSNNFELVNGTTQLQVSSLGSAFETVYRFVDQSTNEIFVSTLNPPGYAVRSLSDPLNTISTPSTFLQSFGQWVPLPIIEPSTVLNPNPSFSTITLDKNAGARGGAPYLNSGSGISTFEIYETTAPQYSGSLRANQINFSYAGLTSNDYTRDVLLYVFDTGANTRLRVGASNFTAQNLAYLSDIPPQISSFQTASISTLTVQTVNGGTPYTTANPQPIPPAVVVSSFNTASISSASISTINGGVPYTTAFPPSASDTFSTLFVCTIQNFDSNILIVNNINNTSLQLNSAGDIIGVAREGYVNFQGLSSGTATVGTILNPTGAGGIGTYSNYVNGPMYLQASTIRMIANRVSMDVLSSGVIGVGSAVFSTSVAAGSQSQPAGRLVMGGTDLDLGQNDLWAQQIRLGAGNATNAQSEISFYDAAGGFKGFNTALLDRTIRVVSTLNGTTGGYILDTAINAPFFSTINSQTNMMAFFPSTINNTIGASTLSVIPQIAYYASAYSSTSQTVLGANTLTPISYNSITKNVGGFTIAGSTITVPVAGTYEIIHSVQFNTTSGSQNVVDFWLLKNGTTVPQTGSRTTVANNAQNLGTVSYYDTAVAGDTYGCAFASADTNMSAGAFGATGVYPDIPSLITNIRWLGSA